MKFKLIGKNKGSIVDNTLENRGIKDLDLYLNPNSDNDTNCHEFVGMDNAIRIFTKHANKGSKVAILVDDDIDGLTSASLSYKACERFGLEVEPVFHRINKERNLSEAVIEDVLATECNLLIIPDAGSNDVEGHKLLNGKGIDIIILDHHKVSVTERADAKHTALVNSNFQIDENNTEELTGVGVVYKFLQALEETTQHDLTSGIIDIVAFGLIADCADYSRNQIRHIVFEGLKNIKNKLILELLKEKIEKGEEITPVDIGFKVAPFLNAIYRIGTVEDKKELFETFNGIGYYSVAYAKRRYQDPKTNKYKFKNVEIDRYEAYAKKLNAYKKQQNQLVQEVMEHVNDNIKDDYGLALCVIERQDAKAISGLVAQKILDKTSKPSIFLVDKGSYYHGSLRAKKGVDYNQWCNETGYCVAAGHDVACGITIKKDEVDKFLDCTSDLPVQEAYEVDYLSNNITKADIVDVYDNRGLFGGTVEPPIIGLQKMKVLKDDITIYDKVIKIDMGTFELAIFHNVQQIGRTLMKGFASMIEVDLVGTADVSSFKGKSTPQIIVKDIEISEAEESEEDKYFF